MSILRDSAAHFEQNAVALGCEPCDRTFNSEQALQQHLGDSPAHVAARSWSLQPASHEAVPQLLLVEGLTVTSFRYA